MKNQHKEARGAIFTIIVYTESSTYVDIYTLNLEYHFVHCSRGKAIMAEVYAVPL